MDTGLNTAIEINADKNAGRINKAVVMSEKEHIKSQQHIIEKFYKEYFSYGAVDIGYKVLTVLFSFIQIVFLALPYEQLYREGAVAVNVGDKEFMAIMLILVVVPQNCYLQSYITHVEKGYMGTIYNRIKYLPVSLKALRVFRFHKMVKFVLKIFVICAVLQLGFSLLIYHRIMLGTIIYLFIYGFAAPFLMGCAFVRIAK